MASPWFPYKRAYGAAKEFYDDTYKLPTINKVGVDIGYTRAIHTIWRVYSLGSDRGPRSFGDREGGDRGDRGPRSFGDRDGGDRGPRRPRDAAVEGSAQ